MLRRIIFTFQSLPLLFSLRILIIHIIKNIFGLYINFSYSQTGEDLILRNLIKNASNLFYIDVGCNDPIKRSNTFWMYLNGGKGICIDANNELINKFKKFRKRDISICAAVSNIEKEVPFYLSNKSEISTIDKNTILNWNLSEKEVKEVMMKTVTLNSILEKYLKRGCHIDVLSIDVEGHDFAVLKSIDLSVYRPAVIIMELHDFQLDQLNIGSDETVKFLAENNYQLKYYATMNAYFVDCKIN